jgi:hypothetical protein
MLQGLELLREGGGKEMEFSINIPYRKVTFLIDVAQPAAAEQNNRLAKAFYKEEIRRQVEKEIARHQERYFVFK